MKYIFKTTPYIKMSGIFLTVWPAWPVSGIGSTDAILQPTKGGWPHITLFYSGDEFTVDKLLSDGMKVINKCIKKQIKLFPENVVINEFFEYSSGKIRFDVLMRPDKESVDIIQELRGQLDIRDSTNVYMNYPHITHSIHYDEEKAEISQKQLREKLELKWGYTVEITGFTID